MTRRKSSSGRDAPSAGLHPMKLSVRTNKFLAPQLTQRRNHSLHSYSGAVCKTESQHWQRYCDVVSKVNINDPPASFEGLSYEQAAPIFCDGYIVWSGLRIADPKSHETIAVVGVGGLGHLAVQYAKASGFQTIAVSGRPTKTSSCGRWVPTLWCETARRFLLRVELTSSLGLATQMMPLWIASRDFGRMVDLY